MRKELVAITLAAVMLSMAVPAMGQGQQNIVLTLMGAGNFTTLTSVVKDTGYNATLVTGGPYTVFAPTDDAFNKLPAGTMDSLRANKPQLTGVLKNHVITGQHTAADLVKLGSVNTLDGRTLKVTQDSNGTVSIDGAKIIKQDVPASNGVIQVVDNVLVPK